MKLIATRVRVRAASGFVGPFDLGAEPGRTVAVLGDRAASALLATLAGRLPAASGTVQYGRERPAYVGPGAPVFPVGLRVAELAALEGNAAEARLARFSLAHLARARADQLSLPEARAIVLLDEPAFDVAPEAVVAIRGALRDPARAVLFSTCSRELAGLADQVVPADSSSPRGAWLTVHVGRGIDALAAELAREAHQLRVEQHGARLRVTGGDPASAARAVARAALATHAEIHALHTEGT